MLFADRVEVFCPVSRDWRRACAGKRRKIAVDVTVTGARMVGQISLSITVGSRKKEILFHVVY